MSKEVEPFLIDLSKAIPGKVKAVLPYEEWRNLINTYGYVTIPIVRGEFDKQELNKTIFYKSTVISGFRRVQKSLGISLVYGFIDYQRKPYVVIGDEKAIHKANPRIDLKPIEKMK